VTVDCAVTAVDEVAAARRLGLDVVVTDHHSPRADGALPDAPIVHPRLNGYPCPDLCAAGVAYKLAQALLAAAGEDPAECDEDLDLVALATVADVVPLRGENRRLVRQGLRALGTSRKPGLRALMDVAHVDPSGVDAAAVGFRLAPRLNAAGRLYRADAGLELLLTEDAERAGAIARELDAVNTERRDVETRIRFEAEALVAQHPPANAYVLAAEGWHPGVIGIVAARIAERHHPPRGADRAGRRRRDGLRPLDPGVRPAGRPARGRRPSGALRRPSRRRGPVAAPHLGRGLPEALCAHAAAALSPDDLVPEVRVDAVAPGDTLSLALAEELEQLAPFGMGNPPVSLARAAARLADPRALGEGRHVAFTLTAGGARSRCVLFGAGSSLPVEAGEPADAAVRLEIDRWNGTVSPPARLRHAAPCARREIEVLGEPESFAAGVYSELDRDLAAGEGARSRVAARCATCAAAGLAGVLGGSRGHRGAGLAVTAHRAYRARSRCMGPGGRLRASSRGSALGGRSRSGGAVHPRRRARPAGRVVARQSVRGRLDPPGMGNA
jgi:single-stranded-DNA-specific exonuclease